MSRRPLFLWLALALAAPTHAQVPAGPAAPVEPPPSMVQAAAEPAAPGPRNGHEIYDQFRAGLAEPGCDGVAASARWRTHFAHAPRQLATHDGDVLPLFGYVVDALRAADLPTEYALIPFVESGYRPGARSPQGPAGLWQMIATTARNHKVVIRPGYDGRLSPVDSTAAAVRYLKTLHGMFGGNWRLAVMAYNAGEYRVLGSIKRSGKTVRTARAESLPGLSPITQAYVRKLHALSCLMEQAHARGEWAGTRDKPVPRLEAVSPPDSAQDLATWARANGQDPARLQRLNPAFAQGRIARLDGKPARVLAFAGRNDDTPAATATGAVDVGATATTTARVDDAQPLVIADASAPLAATADAVAPTGTPAPDAPIAEPLPADATAGRRHTVVRGDNPSRIAARYGIAVAELLSRNNLDARSVLRPGKVLLIDPELVAGTAAAGTR
jgi:membrane-bound lytic murein transglycosylase D